MISNSTEPQKITISTIKSIKDYTRKFLPYSEFSPLTILAWDIENNSKVSYVNDNLVLYVKDELNDHYIQTFLGKNLIYETLLILIQNKLPLKLIPRASLYNCGLLNNIIIKDDINNWDYIYSLSKIDSLTGKFFSDKRNKLNRFNKKYSEISIKIIDIHDKQIQNQIIYLLDQWGLLKGLAYEQTYHERYAIDKSFELCNEIELIPIGLFHRNLLIGYFICEKFDDKYVFGHFIKADYSYKYSYDALFFLSLQKLKQLGYKYINFEQDLGIHGLRQFKRSWRPFKYLKKYTIDIVKY